MNFYVYILKCSDNSYYTGHTDNIEKRLAEHNDKKYASYTSTRLPIELVFLEKFEERVDALIAEQKIKEWSREKKNALINGNWTKIIELSNK
ncbi:MAG: GIY-YIG nuclease family protein [Candidatus Babeliales bacterium]